MDTEGHFVEEWAIIERLIAAMCRRRGLRGADADDFASIVRLKVLEDDCAVLRSFRGDSKLSTYLNVIVQRAFADYCVQERGKWHASAIARRLGNAAMTLERHIVRDGLPVETAIARAVSEHPSLSAGAARALLAQLPPRQRRQKPVPLHTISDSLTQHESADALLLEHERRALSERTADVVRRFLHNANDRDRLLLQLSFGSDLQISKIARVLNIEQKPLYRRREQLLRELRTALTQAGVTSTDIAELMGHLSDETDFGLRKQGVSPSDAGGTTSADEEVTP